MNLRFIDWIWRVRGQVPLPDGQSADDAIAQLEPLFGEVGTNHERIENGLVFRKQNQAAQDRMAVFDDGILHVGPGLAGQSLHYDLASRALLFCFAVPLLFVGFGQAAIELEKRKPPPTAAEKAKEEAKMAKPLPFHPIDKALGAPAPEKPKKGEQPGKRRKKPSAEAAYFFAGLFAFLYLFGRLLESWRVQELFRKRLYGLT